MKLVHKNDESIADMLASAKEAETAKDWSAAEKIYLSIIKRSPGDLRPYSRLMIVYRRQKDFIKELAIIEKAIAAFSKLYTPRAAHSKRIQSLSAKINKAFGMVDKKGNSIYEPGPIATWKKRKILVEKRAKK